MWFRQAIRRLLRTPGVTCATVLTLAIGIGATTAIFSVVNGVLFKPLPFPESERLVALRHQTLDRDDWAASPAIYFTYKEHSRTFDSVALYTYNTASVTGDGNPEELQRLLATYEFLPMLGVTPILGRTFTAADDQIGNPPVVILSNSYWRSRFGGSEDVVGQFLTIDDESHEIIGVLPANFPFLEQPAEIIAAARLNRDFAFVPSFGERGVARLRPGVTLAEAVADAERIFPIMYETFPIVPGISRQQLDEIRLGPNFRSLKEDVVGELDEVLWVLAITIVMLLITACANVANLQLVRVETRTNELAIRTALGAGWAAIARGLIGESILLGLLSGALGLLLSAVGLPLLLSFAAEEIPDTSAVTIDMPVLLFTLAICLGCSVFFGAIPVVKHTAPRIATLLTARGSSSGRERHRVRNMLVITQVAFALVLLVASGWMIRTFQSLRDVDPGFAMPDQIQAFRVTIPQNSVPEFESVVRMQNDIENRLAAIAGVQSVGFSTGLPLVGRGPSTGFLRADERETNSLLIDFRYVSPGFFNALGVPLVAGQQFTWRDYDNARQVVAISEQLALREWGSLDAALGQRLLRSPEGAALEVVAVFGDVRHHGIDQPAPDTIYLTSAESLAEFATRSVYFFVRSDRVGTAAFINELRQAVWSVNSNLPLGSVRTLGDIYRASTARTSLTLTLLGIIGVMSLLLGVIGIYSVISYLVTHRTRELGIRMALGARYSVLQRMLLRQLLLIVGVGVTVGLGSAAVVARLMESLLFGVAALDPVTYGSAIAGLLVAATLAGWLPARRVTRIDAMQALREE